MISYLSDQLFHSSLIDVLICFWGHKVTLAADISEMYFAVFLPEDQCNLHRFVWMEDPQQPFKDFQMTRLTFGISASSFAANMTMKQDTLDNQKEYPLAGKAVLEPSYVHDTITGSDCIKNVVEL